MSQRRALFAAVFVLAACGQPEAAGPKAAPAASGGTLPMGGNFTVMTGGVDIGDMDVTPTETGFNVQFAYLNNGRGPNLSETITLDEDGLPVGWSIEGNTTFGNKVAERFVLDGDAAGWTDSTGRADLVLDQPAFYVPQTASSYMLALAARVLMQDADRRLAALPGGELRLEEIETLAVGPAETRVNVTSYALSGTSLNPSYFLMQETRFFGFISPRFTILRAGYELEDERLRRLAADYGAQRYEGIQSRTAHDFDEAVRIRNVRVFDTASAALGAPVSVVFQNGHIQSIDPLSVATGAQEVEIDGAGGSLVPGLFEMHGHLGESAALLNVAAGVTTIRDMGNNNEVLDDLIGKFESGRLAGPRVIRSGFIEGKSPFSSNNGNLVSSEEEAVAAVLDYANGDFHQIKIYNSMRGEWVPAMVEAARANGLKVAGHVPAFSNADAMIAAGYDELTHINQLMLGWVLGPEEDTRTLLRLTALRRLPGLDLDSDAVQSTLAAMVAGGVAIDPTLAIHERLMLSRNGDTAQGMVDYIDNMPVDVQRSARSAWSDIATPEDDIAYREGFDTLIETVRRMHEMGIALVPGTDLGGGLTFHRELELYQQIGMTSGEILAWASQGMADYLGLGDTLGSITPGKHADMFLVPGDPVDDFKAIKSVSMVVQGGTIYFPSEIYPEFGIVPFADAPAMRRPD